jgi:hypothetical protein
MDATYPVETLPGVQSSYETAFKAVEAPMRLPNLPEAADGLHPASAVFEVSLQSGVIA